MSYSPKVKKVSNAKYETGFSDTFDKLPIWLRWIIFIPASIVLYLICYYLTYFSWYYTLGYDFRESYIGLSVRDVLFVVVPVLTVHDCVPKFKFIIGITISSIYIVLGIIAFTLTWIYRPYDMGIDYFFSDILSCFITVAAAIAMIVAITDHKLSHK